MTTIKARPTTYKGIQMRSRLEAGFAAWLDRISALVPAVSWEYEPLCLASPRGQWLPDFRVRGLTSHSDRVVADYWIEVKPTEPPDEDVHRWADILADNFCPRMEDVANDDPRWLATLEDDFQPAICLVATPKGLLGPIRPGKIASFVFTAFPSCGFAPVTRQPWEGEWWKEPAPRPTPPPPPATQPGEGAAAKARRRLQAARTQIES